MVRPADPDVAGVFGSTSDGRASQRNTRSLLITILGEFVRPNGGAAWTQTIVDATASVGVTEKATRQVLARLDQQGWLERTRIGRRTRWALTRRSTRLLDQGAARIYGHGRKTQSWDGRWSVLLASVGDGSGDRHRLTVGLNWAGYGSLGSGTWISPWVAREFEAARVVADAGVDGATTFVAELGALGDGAELARRAWDLRAVAAAYADFVERVAGGTSSALDGSGAAADLILTVHRWRRFPLLDPQLPAELLPSDWPGGPAADAFRSARAELGPAATAWWLDREDHYGRN